MAACHWWPRLYANLLPPACWETLLPGLWSSLAIPDRAFAGKEARWVIVSPDISIFFLCEVVDYNNRDDNRMESKLHSHTVTDPFIQQYVSLASRPRPAFCLFSTVKREEPGIFSHVRWRNWQMAKTCRTNRQCFLYCSTEYMLNTLCVRQSPPTSYIRVVNYLVPRLFFVVLGPVHPCTIKPDLPSFLSSVTHMRKDTRPSPALLTEATESWAGLDKKANNMSILSSLGTGTQVH